MSAPTTPKTPTRACQPSSACPPTADAAALRSAPTQRDVAAAAAAGRPPSPGGDTAVRVDLDLIRRYDRPVPRYTSYPTAPHFDRAVGPVDLRDALAAQGADTPLSLYLHLPFCRSLCHYCGCHMRVTHRPEVVKKYLCYLRREIRLAARYLDPRRRVVQIHWGGGTPTFLTPIQIESLGRELHRTFNVAPEAEISLEADPRGLTREHLSAAAQAGFNRISFGVQDFDPVVQEAIGRVQPERLTEQAMTWARAEGFRSINFDLVYGLPHQSVASFRRTIDRVVEMDPERIALFSYAHVPTMKKHQRLIPEQALPSPSEKLRLFKMGIERLTTAGGYRFIGMDHFARPDDELSRAQDEGTLYRNFQGYSTHAGAEVVGFGVSAIGQTARLYTQNLKGLRPYYDRLDAGELATYRGYRLSPEDRMRRAVITDVMCHFRLDKRATEARFGLASFDATFAEALRRLKPLEADGLVRVGEDAIAVTDAGRLLVRNVASAFDAYLRAPKEKAHVYSRSV